VKTVDIRFCMPETIKHSYSCIQRLHKRSKEIQTSYDEEKVGYLFLKVKT